MNRKKMITYALLLLCATGLRAMDDDGAAADAAAREGGSELRQRGGAGAGAGGEDPVAAELFGGGDERTILGLTQGQVLGRAARAGHHIRARDVRGALQALREDQPVHRGGSSDDDIAGAICCGGCAVGSITAGIYFFYVLVPAAMNQWAESSYPSP